jgi:Ca2+-transporting ATPase
LCGLDLATLAPAIDAMAGEGLRVLGVAQGIGTDGPFPETPAGFKFEFRGFVGLADPLRASVKAAVAQCRTAGIAVKMITGDYPLTALAIAREAGLDAKEAVTGEALAAMDDAALDARVKTANVFARIMPEQKLRIVEALKRGGETVAMTGDGVNDAPSLKAAHIGIAMGGRGTDVAREASAIVLLDDDFGAIVASVRLGRRIYDNLRKAMAFIFAVHVPIAGLSLLPLVLGLPPLFAPVHIAFLEMVIDPVCALVFEAETEEDDAMARKPRDPEAPLFSRALVVWGCVQGLAAFAVTGAIYLVGVRNAMSADELRALTFFALVVTIVALILVNRAFGASPIRALFRPNRTLAFVVAAVAACLAATLLIPAARDLFRFGPLHADDMAVVAGAGLAMLLLLEGAKLLAPGARKVREGA